MIFAWNSEVKDSARKLEAVMEQFEVATSKQRLSDIKLHKHIARMRREMEAAVDYLRRM